MTEKQMNQLLKDVATIKSQGETQGKKLDEVHTAHDTTRIDVAKIQEKLQMCVDSINGISRKLSNGMSDQVTKLEATTSNIATEVSHCQKRSAGRWKLLFGLFVMVTVPTFGYLCKVLIEHVGK